MNWIPFCLLQCDLRLVDDWLDNVNKSSNFLYFYSLEYRFNGLGEFWMVKLEDEESRCEVQTRTRRWKNEDTNKFVDATVCSAVLLTCPPVKDIRTSIEVKLNGKVGTGKYHCLTNNNHQILVFLLAK